MNRPGVRLVHVLAERRLGGVERCRRHLHELLELSRLEMEAVAHTSQLPHHEGTNATGLSRSKLHDPSLLIQKKKGAPMPPSVACAT